MEVKKKRAGSKKEALNYISNYCSKEEHCIFEVRTKLLDFSLTDSDIDEIIQDLISANYIDENRYSQAFANDKYKFNKWGKHKIAFALRNKKISDKTIQTALELIPDEFYIKQLNAELTKKINSLHCSSPFELKGKLFRFAAGRGYESDLIQEAINHLLEE
jgi:regulatory protein